MDNAPITHALIDNDGVLRREKKQLPGVPELFSALYAAKIHSVIVSNNSRKTSDDVVDMMHRFGVTDFTREEAITSAEAAAEYFADMVRKDILFRLFVLGSPGLWKALEREEVPTWNDTWQDGKWIDERPTHVLSGWIDGAIDHKTQMGPAYNALHHGAELIGTNPDPVYKNAKGMIMPAHGAQLDSLRAVAPNPLILGKPEKGMAEVALGRSNAEKSAARIAVLGDTVPQDMRMAENLRNAGWKAEGWMVLSGATNREEAEEALAEGIVQRIFEDITEVREHLLQ